MLRQTGLQMLEIAAIVLVLKLPGGLAIVLGYKLTRHFAKRHVRAYTPRPKENRKVA